MPFKKKKSFSRNQRVRVAHEFKEILKGKAYFEDGLVLYAKNGLSNADRLGIIISKRQVKKAVERNKIKRQIREAFRNFEETGIKASDFVARLKNYDDTKSIGLVMTRLLKKAWMAKNGSVTTINN